MGVSVSNVPHPDFIFIAPKGSWVIIADKKDRQRHISTLLIEEVTPLRKGGARRAKRSG